MNNRENKLKKRETDRHSGTYMTIIKVLTFVLPEYGKKVKLKKKIIMTEDLPNSNISVISVLAFIVFTLPC